MNTPVIYCGGIQTYIGYSGLTTHTRFAIKRAPIPSGVVFFSGDMASYVEWVVREVGLTEFRLHPYDTKQGPHAVLGFISNKEGYTVVGDCPKGLSEEDKRSAISYASEAVSRVFDLLDTGRADLERVPSKSKRQALRKATERVTGRKGVEYKILKILPTKDVTPQASLGGTHASPRTHLRRGHTRTYKTGKQVWIDALTVKGEGGTIIKDYEVVH